MTKVLVVEDSFEIRLALEMALEEEGYTVRTAKDGPSGLVEFKAFQPDLAILDLRLPGMDGTDVCRAIRVESAIPVIMFSALQDESERTQALACGASDYLVKSAGLEGIIARVGERLAA
jgi:DNA-binding response OmpR family regulator